MARRSSALLLGSAILFATHEATAYRPFDGTDADVAKVGEFELELGPSHFYTQGGRQYLLAPAAVLNLGFARNLELVSDFKDFVGLNPGPRESTVRVLDTDVLLKWVLRRGRLQGESGLSLALEVGPWLPELGGDDRVGAQANFICSYRFGSGTLHFNEQAALTRAHQFDAFSSVILEGPPELVVRPVAEVFVEHSFGDGSEYSALVGAIWSVQEALSLDVGVRAARVGRESAGEVRLGFTWAVGVWSPQDTATTHPFPGPSEPGSK